MALVRDRSSHPLADIIERLENDGAMLPESPMNVIEVVGILESYGYVLDAYWKNLTYIANHQFLVLFPAFKYFNGEVTPQKWFKHIWHDRINFEYAEYCMKGMLWHGGGGIDAYLDTPEFVENARRAIAARTKGNPLMQGLNTLFPEFLVEQVRLMVYYSALGQFWEVMSPIFLDMGKLYRQGKMKSIKNVVDFVRNGLVAAAGKPISYAVEIGGQTYEILPKEKGFTFLMDTAVPYVEAVFFRSFPFLGTVSYNAQAQQIPPDMERFAYGALYADPLPTGTAGVPPTLLMQDMRHYLPDYLHTVYQKSPRGEEDIRVLICQSFQKSMFCVTTAAIQGLAPHPLATQDPTEQQANRKYLEAWMDRFMTSRIASIQPI